MLLVGVSVPHTVAAYATTAQSASRLTDIHALFTITYRFGHGSRDMYLPAATAWNLKQDASEKLLGYEVMTDDETVTNGITTAGIVFSNAQLVHSQYFIPAGETREFTFTTIIRTQPETTEAEYNLGVTNLPFQMGVDAKIYQQGLNQFELSNYQTPTVTLNPTNS